MVTFFPFISGICSCGIFPVAFFPTVMRIIILKIFPVPVKLFLSLHVFYHFFLYLRTLYIVWSLVRRWATQCLTRLQTMCNVIKYRKCSKTFRCGSVAVIFSIYLRSVLCMSDSEQADSAWTDIMGTYITHSFFC